ncbi:hypothetical protein Tco_0665687, partial [Tanacetum coccineum]
TLPPPPTSLDTETVADIAEFQALSVAQETASVENIRLRKRVREGSDE